MKIITNFVYPPIPDRQCDWSAVLENYDGGNVDYDTPSRDRIGRGPTREAAIADLMHYDCPKCGEVDGYYWLKSSAWCSACDTRFTV